MNADPKITDTYVRVDRPIDGARRVSGAGGKIQSSSCKNYDLFCIIDSCVNADPKMTDTYVRVDRPIDGARRVSGTGGKIQSSSCKKFPSVL